MSLRDVWGALNSGKPATTSRVAWPDAPLSGQSVWPTSEPNGGLLELSAPQTSPKRHQHLQPKHRSSASSPVKTHNSHSKLFQRWIILCSCIKVPYPSHTWVMGHHSTITRVFLPSSSADLAVGLSNRWFFKPGLKTFNSPFHLTQRRSLTFNNIMNGYLQHDWWVWVPYIVTLGVGLFGFLWVKILDIGRFSRGSNHIP